MQLQRMRNAIDLQELAFSYLAAQFAATDFYDEDGSLSPVDWIRIHCHMTSHVAADRVRVGEHIPELPRSIAAMAHGDLLETLLGLVGAPGPGRRALQARDGSCRWPGCERAASRSAARHVVHWIHGGTTDLDNLVLLATGITWMVHEGNWQVVRGDDGRMLAIPPTVTFGPRPRAPD